MQFQGIFFNRILPLKLKDFLPKQKIAKLKNPVNQFVGDGRRKPQPYIYRHINRFTWPEFRNIKRLEMRREFFA